MSNCPSYRCDPAERLVTLLWKMKWAEIVVRYHFVGPSNVYMDWRSWVWFAKRLRNYGYGVRGLHLPKTTPWSWGGNATHPNIIRGRRCTFSRRECRWSRLYQDMFNTSLGSLRWSCWHRNDCDSAVVIPLLSHRLLIRALERAWSVVVRVGGSTTDCEVCGRCWSCKTGVTSGDTVTGWDTLFKMFTASDGFSLPWSTDTDAMTLHGLVSSKTATQFTRGDAVGLVPLAGPCATQSTCAHMNPPDWSVFKNIKAWANSSFQGTGKAR